MRINRARRWQMVAIMLIAAYFILSSYALSEGGSAGIAVGDIVSFGGFEQDRKTDNGPEPIEWQVLSVTNGRALLISLHALDNLSYNDTKGDITWADCTIRQWLNGEFYDGAFSSSEKSNILVLEQYNDQEEGNPKWAEILGGANTSDSVFLLSYREVNLYFENNKAAECTPTTYAKKRGAKELFTGACTWWLRSPGRVQYDGCFISTKGKPDTSNAKDKRGIRPAIWVNVAALSLPGAEAEAESVSEPTAEPTPATTPIPTEEPTPTPEPTPQIISSNNLRGVHGYKFQNGSRGDAVKYIQQMLIDQSYLPSGQADGAFGPKTEAAVIEFQRANGLDPTGVVDLPTQFMLSELESGFSPVSGRTYEYAGLKRYGVYRFEGGVFIGILRSDQSYQEGTMVYDDGSVYAGSFKNNQRSGKGEAWFPNGDYYTGDWIDDKINGKGVYHFGSETSTEQYNGEWVDGRMSGKGIYTLPNGTTIKGKWEYNQQIGWWK